MLQEELYITNKSFAPTHWSSDKMQAVDILPKTNILPSPAPQAKRDPTNVADTPFNKALAQQIQDHKNSKEPEKNTGNKTDSASSPDIAASKKDESDSLSDGKIMPEAIHPDIDSIPTPPVELLALVTNKSENIGISTQFNGSLQVDTLPTIPVVALAARVGNNHITNKSENTDISSQSGTLLQPFPANEISKGPLAILDSKQDKLDLSLHASHTSNPTSSLSSRATMSSDRHVGLQTEFGTTAQKMHEMSIPTSTPVIAQMSQAPLNLLQASTTHLTEKLTPQVGTQAWDQAVGQKIVWMVAGAQQSATLTLNPPDLGPLQIVLNVNNNQADATFISTQPEVRHALEAALPKLREMMNEAGIQLSDATVSSNASSQHGASQEHSRRASNNFKENHLNSAAVSQTIQTRSLITGKRMVDTFA